jgi:hypothetical protein
MTLLSQHQNDLLKRRFPDFELSYETIIHKNVPANYNLALAIPNGRKSYVWFSFHKDTDVAYLLDIDKDKRVVKSSILPITFEQNLSLGTIIYGVFLSETNVFVIEDIYFFKGITMQYLTTGEKLVYTKSFLDTQLSGLKFVLPIMWYNNSREPDKIDEDTIPYPVHHIQYRALSHIVPFLNQTIVRKPNAEKEPSKVYIRPISLVIPDYNKPQYKQSTIFQVTADMQYDIYHIHAFGKNNTPVYYNTAYIPNYKSSVFMNELFRNIKENRNLDYIEESDDEADFEDIREDRFVDLKKNLNMECIFNHKFKRWVPIRVVKGHCKIVHISQLARQY